MIYWYKSKRDEARNSENEQVRKHVQRNELRIDDSITKTIKCWIYRLKEIQRKVVKYKTANDIRKLFVL